MCKFAIVFTLLLVVCQQVSGDPAFSVFRSADFQLNRTSHRDSSWSAFAPDGHVEADLAGQPNQEGDLSETHPIDFSRIDLSKYSSTSKAVLNSMQNDEVRRPAGLFNRRRSTTRFGARQATGGSIDFNAKNLLLNYNYLCSPSNYLAECLRKRLSSKFLERFEANRSATANGLRSMIEDLNRLSSAPGSPTNTRMRLALDRTFYDSRFLSPLMSNCISAYRRNCDKVTQQTLFQ